MKEINPKDVAAIQVGKRFPAPAPPFDCLNLTLPIQADGTETADPIRVFSRQPTFLIWLEAPTTWEETALSSTCFACGIYARSDFPYGIPMFIFNGNGKAFVVKAPLIASPQEISQWNPEINNGCVFYLVERKTGILKQTRILGLQADFAETLQGIWRKHASQHSNSTNLYNSLVSTRNDEDLWKLSHQWFWNDNSEEFEKKNYAD